MPKSFRDAKTSGDDGNRWEEDLPFAIKDIRDIAKGEYTPIRLVGYCEPFMRFWVPTEANKAYDPYKTKAKMYPSVCVDFDPVDEVFSGNSCLYRKAHYRYVDDDGNEQWGKLKPTRNYLIFFIDRERQEERAGIPLKKKYKLAQKFSDIQCATVPTAFAKSVQNAIEMHAKKVGKEVDPTDPDEGFDLFFKFDKDAKAEAKYNIQLGDASPLSKEERKQAELVPESVSIYPKDSEQRIRESLERSGYVIVEAGESPEEAKASKKANKRRPSTTKAGVELTDDDDEDEPAPRRRKSTKAKKSEPEEETFEDEDNDLDLDDNLDDDDTDDTDTDDTDTDTGDDESDDGDDEFNFDDDDDDFEDDEK